MNTAFKRGFWKNFNLKVFLLIAMYMFLATLLVGCIWNLIASDPVSTLLTTSALFHRLLDAVIAGFLVYALFIFMKRKYRD